MLTCYKKKVLLYLFIITNILKNKILTRNNYCLYLMLKDIFKQDTQYQLQVALLILTIPLSVVHLRDDLLSALLHIDYYSLNLVIPINLFFAYLEFKIINLNMYLLHESVSNVVDKLIFIGSLEDKLYSCFFISFIITLFQPSFKLDIVRVWI